jgi:predicted nucleotidyltransferase
MADRHIRTVDPCVLELRALLARLLGDEFVCLYHYGSRLEGDAAPDSDYDVACVTRTALSAPQIGRLIDASLDIQMARDVVFDLHFFTQRELESAPLSYTPFVQEVKERGVLV